MEKFGNLFLSFEGVTDGSSIKNSRSVGLFFGANWCEPCKIFLPKLSKIKLITILLNYSFIL